MILATESIPDKNKIDILNPWLLASHPIIEDAGLHSSIMTEKNIPNRVPVFFDSQMFIK